MKLNAPFSDDKPRALVLGNGSYPDENQTRNIIQKSSFIVCANGGSIKAREFQINPDIIIGDIDSIDSGTIEYFIKQLDIPIIKNLSQEENDLEKSIIYLLKHGYNRFILVGFMGKRDDHTIATLQIVKKYLTRAEFQIFSEYSEIFLLKKGFYEFQTVPQQIISLFGFPHARGVSTKSLKYPLVNEHLQEGSRGLSNQAISEKVSIKINSGTLLVIKINSTV
ncbi:MAG: thiamine diphosphokinase [Candidatus Neomarinimicrobiota bacterium]|nr:MAG: thiamine diphosphokinase [Candidatus Neomarinimicrobiota bacterium]